MRLVGNWVCLPASLVPVSGVVDDVSRRGDSRLLPLVIGCPTPPSLLPIPTNKPPMPPLGCEACFRRCFSYISSRKSFDERPLPGLSDPSGEVRAACPVFLLSEFALIKVAEGSPGGAGAFRWGNRLSGLLSSKGETRGWSKSTFLPTMPSGVSALLGSFMVACLRLARYSCCFLSCSSL